VTASSGQAIRRRSVVSKIAASAREGDFVETCLAALNRRRLMLKANRRSRTWDMDAARGGYRMVTISGARLALPCDSQLSALIFRGDFEVDELCFVRAFLRPGDVVFDIGANIGLYSVIAGRAVGPTGRVFAFEPNPAAFTHLRHNVRINRLGNVTCVSQAASDTSERRDLSVVLEGWDAYSSFGTITGRPAQSVAVNVETIDTFVAAYGLGDKPVAFVKIDVEGWEPHVLAGATELLSRTFAPVVQIELNAEALASAGATLDGLYKTLTDLGLGLWSFSRFHRRLLPFRRGTEIRCPTLHAIKDPQSVERRIADGGGWRLGRPGLGLW